MLRALVTGAQGGMQIIPLDRDHPEIWTIGPAVEALRKGGLVVLPTDTIYALACDPWNSRAVNQLYAAKGMDKSKRCAVVCRSIRDVGSVARAVTDDCFRFMRGHFPGPYTLLLHASRDLPRQATGKRKTIGVRIPDHPVCEALAEDFGRPLLVTSLPNWEEGAELDPIETSRRLFKRPSVVLDCGPLIPQPSTVIDYTVEPPELVRMGLGEVLLEAG